MRLLRALDDELLLESIEELVSQGIQGLAILAEQHARASPVY